MKNARKLISVLLAVAAVFSLCACSQTDEEVIEEATTAVQQVKPPSKNSITLPIAHNDTLDPFKNISSVNRSLITLLYDGLIYIDKNFTPQSILISGYSNSGTLMAVKLKSGIVFSDGSAITADDVVYSFEKAKASSFYAARLSGIKSASASGDMVNFTLHSPNTNALACLDFPIVKKGTVQALNSGDNIFDIVPPVGAGRYIISGTLPTATLIPNPRCNRKEKMAITSISLFEVNDSEGLAYGLQVGNYDYWYNDLSSGSYSRVNAGLSVVPTNNLVYIAFNDEKSIFTENAVRRAVSVLLDRDAIASQGFQGHATSSSLPFNPYWSAMDGITPLSKMTADINGAKTILEQAGYTSINSYGYRCSSRKSLTCSLTVCKDNEFKVATAKQIKEQLAKLNFNVKIVELSYKDYTQAIADGNYDMYLGELKIPANMNISQFFTENSITNSAITLADQNENTFTVCAAEYRNMLAGSMSMSDFCNLFEKEMPFVPVCYRSGIEIYSRKISSQTNSTCYDNFCNIDSWTVKT